MGSCVCPKCGILQSFSGDGCPPGYCRGNFPSTEDRETLQRTTPDATPCKFFLQGRCTRGEECKFSHSTGTPRPQPQAQSKKTPCRNIAKGKPCPYGHLCHFSHSS